jgi:hypothetical protein
MAREPARATTHLRKTPGPGQIHGVTSFSCCSWEPSARAPTTPSASPAAGPPKFAPRVTVSTSVSCASRGHRDSARREPSSQMGHRNGTPRMSRIPAISLPISSMTFVRRAPAVSSLARRRACTRWLRPISFVRSGYGLPRESRPPSP